MRKREGEESKEEVFRAHPLPPSLLSLHLISSLRPTRLQSLPLPAAASVPRPPLGVPTSNERESEPVKAA